MSCKVTLPATPFLRAKGEKEQMCDRKAPQNKAVGKLVIKSTPPRGKVRQK